MIQVLQERPLPCVSGRQDRDERLPVGREHTIESRSNQRQARNISTNLLTSHHSNGPTGSLSSAGSARTTILHSLTRNFNPAKSTIGDRRYDSASVIGATLAPDSPAPTRTLLARDFRRFKTALGPTAGADSAFWGARAAGGSDAVEYFAYRDLKFALRYNGIRYGLAPCKFGAA